MSKDELKKWENKLKLWVILHPGYGSQVFKNCMIHGVMCCPFFDKNNFGVLTNNSWCLKRDEKKFMCDKSLTKFIEATGVSKSLLDKEFGGRIYNCIEWIKHV